MAADGWSEDVLEASAPDELAIPVALPLPVFVATNVTAPPAVRSVFVVAILVSLSTSTATAAPIAALLPAAVAFAVTTLAPLCTDVALMFPVTDNADARLPIVADDSPLTTPTAAEAPILVPAVAAEPAVTVVVALSVLSALSVRLWAPVSDTPFVNCASAVLIGRFNATDAPTPTLPPAAVDIAIAVFVESLADVSVTSPTEPPVIVTVAPVCTAAVDSSVVGRFSANAPATLAPLPALAPELAVAL